MTRKLTRITPVIDGYAVVIEQGQSKDGTPGEFVGCFLQTPESPDNGPYILLTEAMRAYMDKTNKSHRNDSVDIPQNSTKIRRLTYL